MQENCQEETMLFSSGPFQPLEQVEKWLILIVAQLYSAITCK